MGPSRRAGLRRPPALIAALFLLVGLPLAATSVTAIGQAVGEQAVHSSASGWADSVGRRVVNVTSRGSEMLLRTKGARCRSPTRPASLLGSIRRASIPTPSRSLFGRPTRDVSTQTHP
ncbi:hypothetical protein GCM10007382_23710 [Salinibacterium xinjiangense]|nr:hypothetical protein GCM10007382_23710 [Salinibacterium xinjiangense]